MNDVKRERRPIVNGEGVIVAAFLLLALYYGYETFSFRTTLMEDVIGPASFPRLISALSVLFCVLYFVRNLKAGGAARMVPAETSGTLGEEFIDLFPIILMLFYVLLLEPLGFLVSTLLYIGASMVYLGQGLARSLAWALFLTVMFFSLFYLGLKTEIPMGRWIHTEELLPFLLPLRDSIGG